MLLNSDNLRSFYKMWINNEFKGLPGTLWVAYSRNYLRETMKQINKFAMSSLWNGL